MGFSMQLISYAVCECRKAIPAETPCVLHEDHEVVLAHHPIFVLQTNGMNPMENHPEGPQQILQKSTKARDSK